MLPKLDFAKHQSSLTTKSLYILSLFHADVQTNSNENGGTRLNHPFRAQKMRGVLSSGGGSERSVQHFEERALSTCRQSIPLSLRYVEETPPQDTTKSTHSTTTLTEKTLTHNSLPEDMVWMGAYMLSIWNIYAVWIRVFWSSKSVMM